MSWIFEPWPWYISGPLITVTMAALLFAGKNFGMSSNLRTLCTMCGGGKTCEFFCFDWRSQRWNLIVMVGAVLGGFIAMNFLSNDTAVDINNDVVTQLQQMGFKSAGSSYAPSELFGNEAFSSVKTIILLLIGGFFVGFGARYAGGCTSGHAISGLSNLQLPSLIAVIGFFIGGLIMIHLLFPLIF
ncbi:YeeE/YedE family protein [Flavobacterium arcticum]|uniref:YeeE/YedE family protein n=1 Tax=Flavobacterium arcticum TaxID=1784713 RepID=A0A345HAF6_9FLAO|nr:YeeE/YedE thiosulfate transporter family protein [Flavobacterium arcticum]AXG73566.1 YeeE/YedE family protein [Flavobacterium arcticum]KAF2513359.1 YeeE/YedE family protein [Flavobacterium arcticum]